MSEPTRHVIPKPPKLVKASSVAAWIVKQLSPETWTKDAYARPASGLAVTGESGIPECKLPVSMCAIGWIVRANNGVEERIRYTLKAVIGSDDIPGWNDESIRTFEDVKAAFEETVKRLKDEERAAKKGKVA